MLLTTLTPSLTPNVSDCHLCPPRECGCQISILQGNVHCSNAGCILLITSHPYRYQEEFLELAELACGEFGVVKKARHRLDGMVYAIKVSKKTIRKNSHDEKMAMNEVFAHAALMKHKHVVRYYNSWVESGAVSETELDGQISPKLSIFRSTYRTSTVREEVFRGRSMTSDRAVSGSLRRS